MSIKICLFLNTKKIFRIVILASLTANIIFFSLGFYFVQKQGGVQYIKNALIFLFPETDTQQLEDKFLKISLLDERLSINGLPWFHEDKPFLWRLPKRFKNRVRPVLWKLAKRPSGGRIRFKTDSEMIGIKAQCPNPNTPYHMTSIAKNGLDLYVDNCYAGSAYPYGDGSISTLWEAESVNTVKSITIYLPLHESIQIDSILVEKDAHIYPADDLLTMPPIIYYGSSITQGGCASNPGLSYQAILSRRLGVDFINLGFSGNGLGDSEIAELITDIECSALVLDYWANPSADIYMKTLPHFVDIIRKQHKNIPILVVSPFYVVNREFIRKEKRKIAFDFVQQRQAEGDPNIIFVEGTTMISKRTAYGLIDGMHCNSLGFWFCANALEPILRNVLVLDIPG